MRSGMFTSVNGDRKYTSSFFAEYFASFIGNGVFPDPSSGMQVMADNGLDILVSPGKAWIDGYVLFNDDGGNLTIDPGDSLLGRIDKVVIRMNKISREIVVDVKKGKPATNPTIPKLQRDEDMHELGIANIRVGKGQTVIEQRHITDLRHDKSQCGIVIGLIEQIDTTTLFNEYQSWIANKKQEYDSDLISYTADKKQEWDNWFNATSTDLEQDFDSWFTLVKDTLSEDAAGNLLKMISEVPVVKSGLEEPEGLKSGDFWLRELS